MSTHCTPQSHPLMRSLERDCQVLWYCHILVFRLETSAATIAALRSQVAHYKGRVARLIREKKRLRILLKERLVNKLKETVKRRDAKIRKLNTKLTSEQIKFLRNKQRREKYMRDKFVDRVTEYKTREKAMKQQLQQSEKNVVELTQEMTAVQNSPPSPVLREGKSKQ